MTKHLVLIQNDKITTTSLIIAEKFEKEHKHVLEAIKNLECSEKFRRFNFIKSSYINSQNKEQPMYKITKKGYEYITGKFRDKTYNAVEHKIRNKLAVKLNGNIEVLTPVGRIDILTDKEVIEIKKVARWKSAIGQILVYGYYYPNHKKVIYLYGNINTDMQKLIEKHCKKLNINTTFKNNYFQDKKSKTIAAEAISQVNLIQEEADGYYECKPICDTSSEMARISMTKQALLSK